MSNKEKYGLHGAPLLVTRIKRIKTRIARLLAQPF